MRVFNDNLEVRPGRPKAVRKHPRPQDKQTYNSGATAVATVWLVFYLLAIGHSVASSIVSRAIEFAAR